VRIDGIRQPRHRPSGCGHTGESSGDDERVRDQQLRDTRQRLDVIRVVRSASQGAAGTMPKLARAILTAG
jgi:hypothetical protein